MIVLASRMIIPLVVVPLALGASSLAARPLPVKEIRLLSPGACPSPEGLSRALRRVFPDAQIFQSTKPAGQPGSAAGEEVVAITDLGVAFRAEVAGQARIFDDPARRCDERAVTAAVFVAFVLEPPTVVVPPTRPATVSMPAANHATPTPRVAWKPRLELEVAGLFEATPRSGAGNALLTGGGSLRLSLGAARGRGWLGGILGISGLAPVTMDLDGAKAGMVRVPIDLGLRGGWRWGHFGLLADLEAMAAVVIIRGENVPLPLQSVGLDLGLRAALQFQFWQWRRLAPFVAIETVITPTTHDLIVSPTGPAGKTPVFWLGCAIGIAVRLF